MVDQTGTLPRGANSLFKTVFADFHRAERKLGLRPLDELNGIILPSVCLFGGFPWNVLPARGREGADSEEAGG